MNITRKNIMDIVNDADSRMKSCDATQEVHWKVKEGFAKHHWYIKISTGSTSAYESCSIKIHGNGLVIAQGNSTSFNDFLGLARGTDKGFFTVEQIKNGVDKFIKSWENAMSRNCKRC